jgi:hypothetical protein
MQAAAQKQAKSRREVQYSLHLHRRLVAGVPGTRGGSDRVDDEPTVI